MWWMLFFGYLLLLILLYSSLPFKKLVRLNIPESLQKDIAILEKHSESPYEYIKSVADYLLSQVKGRRFDLITHLNQAFETSIPKLLKREGVMHSHHLSFLAYLMLVNSKFFSSDDIRLRTKLVNFLPHFYLEVQVAGQWYAVDLWAYSLGSSLGSKSGFFK